MFECLIQLGEISWEEKQKTLLLLFFVFTRIFCGCHLRFFLPSKLKLKLKLTFPNSSLSRNTNWPFFFPLSDSANKNVGFLFHIQNIFHYFLFYFYCPIIFGLWKSIFLSKFVFILSWYKTCFNYYLYLYNIPSE